MTKRNNESVISSVNNDIDNYAILDDLDVRASDLLQSNGIIWVEGPSDRVYIKHWLHQFCQCSFKEGSDYQFLYYGGRLWFRPYFYLQGGIYMNETKIKVLKVESMKHPEEVMLNNTLRALQAAARGLIEIVNLEDDVCLFCNEEGNLIDLDV